jgi:hypothetical protein
VSVFRKPPWWVIYHDMDRDVTSFAGPYDEGSVMESAARLEYDGHHILHQVRAHDPSPWIPPMQVSVSGTAEEISQATRIHAHAGIGGIELAFTGAAIQVVTCDGAFFHGRVDSVDLLDDQIVIDLL